MSSFDRTATLNQAVTALRTGELAQARQACEQMLARDAADPDALNIIGSAALQQGMLDEAEKWFEQAVHAQPLQPGLLINLAKCRMQKGLIDDAITAFNKAIALQPHMDMALAGRAEALNLRGDSVKARATLEPAVRTRRDGIESAMVYATLLQQDGEHQAVVDLTRRHLNTSEMRGFSRYRLGLLLGKSLEAQGEYAKAFEAYAAANAASGSSVSFDPAQAEVTVNRLIEFFSAQRLPELPHAANDSQVPIFIAGMARSGTTLVEQIIQSHPQAQGGGEIVSLDLIASTITKQPGGYPISIATTPAEAMTRWSKWYLDGVLTRHVGATRLVDKNLRNVAHIGLICLLFPKARIIHCTRDPLDTCLSCFFSPLSPIRHPYSTNLNQIGLYHRLQERLMTHWHAASTVPIFQVQYEDLIANQESVTRNLIAYCGLDWDDQCLRPHESRRIVKTLSFDQVRRPLYDTSIGRYKHYEQHLGPLRDGLAGVVIPPG